MALRLAGTNCSILFDDVLESPELPLKSIFRQLVLLAQGEQTPIEPTERKTGVGHDAEEATSGAEPESAGNNPQVVGDPNQGTESK